MTYDMQKYITDKSEVNFDFEYPDTRDQIFSELRNIVKINLITEENEIEKVKIIAGYVHNLFQHNGNNKPSSFNPITIINEVKLGKSFRCVEYSYLTTALLWAYNIPARIVGLKTKDMETRETSAGHVVMEFYSTEYNKWIMVDTQEGILFKSGNTYLSSLELENNINQNINIEFILVNNSNFSTVKDSEQYINWIKEYLYFYDTPLRINFTEIITDADRLNAKKVMLIPLGIKNPKVFQKIFPINAIYTHSILDFYKK